MNELDVNLIEQITKYLSFNDMLKLSYCNRNLNTFVNSINQYKKYDKNIKSQNIFEIYDDMKHSLHNIIDKQYLYDKSLTYDLEWCFTRFQSERKVKQTGLTKEQQTVVNFPFSNGDILLVQAFAGTGKTTTLIEYAKKHCNKSVLYLTFNKSLVENAKTKQELNHVNVCTMHSLALQKVDPNSQYNIGKISLVYIEERLNIHRTESNLVKKVLENFFSSNSKHINVNHVNKLNLNNEEEIICKSNIIWTDIKNKKCKMPHDGYLKLFQIEKQILDFDIIMLDEAQDSTECMLNIIKYQTKAVRILVGDIHQQIYGFRNVQNPFVNNYESHNIHKFSLTESFRYGYQICFLANKFLKTYKNEHNKIISHSLDTKIKTNLNQCDNYTIVTRSNIQVYHEAFKIKADNLIHIIGKSINFDKECLYAENIHLLINNIIPNHPKFTFNSIDEMKIHYNMLGNYKWITRINLVQYYDINIIQKYRQLQQQISDIHMADVIITTTHQAKGLEFDNVKLSDDFIPLITTQKTIYCYKSSSAIEAYNILYVAMTRAKKLLILNKELYEFLQILKGNRVFEYKDKICSLCNKYITTRRTEECITCIGFDSKIIYTYTHNCACDSK